VLDWRGLLRALLAIVAGLGVAAVVHQQQARQSSVRVRKLTFDRDLARQVRSHKAHEAPCMWRAQAHTVTRR